MERPDYSKFLLVMAMVLALFIAAIPHLNYPYPVHVDEWVHLAYSDSLVTSGHIAFLEPFTGESAASIVYYLESGFHVITATLHNVTGLSIVDIARYFPAVIFLFTVFSIFVLARREGFGWEAAFFTCFIPTNVGLLGPAFFVPIIINLSLIALTLLLAFYHRSAKSYVLLTILLGFMVINHVTSAILLVLILIPYALITVTKEPKHVIILVLIGLVPFLATLPWTHGLIGSTWQSLFEPKPVPAFHDIPYIIDYYGYLPIAVVLIGVLWLSLKGGRQGLAILLGAVVLAAMMATFYSLHYGVAELYLRGTIVFYLMLGLLGGAGLMSVKKVSLLGRFPVWTRPLGRHLGWGLAAILAVVALAVTLPGRLSTPYYHMIDNHDYTTFTWVQENIGDAFRKAILDPWKASAFTALTGKNVFARITTAPDRMTNLASQFLADGSRDTRFMLDNRITIVVTDQEVVNPDLVKVRDMVYIRQSIR